MSENQKSRNPLVFIFAFSFVLFLLFIGASTFVFIKSRDPGKLASSLPSSSLLGSSTDAVGVIEINGPIMDSKKIVQKIESMDEKKEIKAIVVRLNSPGGAVGPSQEIYEAVKAVKKPVVASMGSIAASGAFYIAMGAKKIYTNPGTITGSIGVIMEFANLEKLYDWAKIKRYVIKTGKYKDAGSEFREMRPDEKELLQGMVDDVLLQFKKAVAEGRKMSPEEVTAIADGRIFSGAQAKGLKLVDELGTLQDAINDVAKMAKIKGKPKVIYSDKKKNRIIDFLMDEGDDSEAESEYQSSWLERSFERVIRRVFGQATSNALILEPGIYWMWRGAR